MKRIILPLALIASACNKEYTAPVPTCQRVYLLSDKYSADSIFLRTDSLWPWGRVNNVFCGKDTLVFTEPMEGFKVCDLNLYEIRRYVIGNKLTNPKIFK